MSPLRELPEAVRPLTWQALQTAHRERCMIIVTLVQAAYKAVIAKKYSDIKHLSGGVYGRSNVAM